MFDDLKVSSCAYCGEELTDENTEEFGAGLTNAVIAVSVGAVKTIDGLLNCDDCANRQIDALLS